MRIKGRLQLTGTHTVDDRIGHSGKRSAPVDVGDTEQFHVNVTPV